jgi:hypothetical protein
MSELSIKGNTFHDNRDQAIHPTIQDSNFGELFFCAPLVRVSHILTAFGERADRDFRHRQLVLLKQLCRESSTTANIIPFDSEVR